MYPYVHLRDDWLLHADKGHISYLPRCRLTTCRPCFHATLLNFIAYTLGISIDKVLLICHINQLNAYRLTIDTTLPAAPELCT